MKPLKEVLLDILGWEQYKSQMKHRFAPRSIDATQFGDPFAKLISWKRIDSNSQYVARRLKTHGSSCVKFGLSDRIKCELLILPWIVIAIASPFTTSVGHLVGFGIILVIACYLVLLIIAYHASVRPIFDKRLGLYWKSRGKRDPSEGIKLTDIHALQLLAFMQFGRGNLKAAGVVYQLNLVLKDRKRREVYTQRQPSFGRGRRALIADANKLSRFLRVPLWDAIHEYDR